MIIKKVTTKEYDIFEIGVDHIEYTERFKSIRSGFRYKMTNCFQCNAQFQIGDKISLGICAQGNKVFCHDCAVKIKEAL